MTGEKITDLPIDPMPVTVSICRFCEYSKPDDGYELCKGCTGHAFNVIKGLRHELAESNTKLRDQFAMAALTMLDDEERDGDVLAYRAYAIADAMLAEREKGARP